MKDAHSTKEKYLGIEIDYSRDKLIPEQGIALLTGKGFYKKDHETSPQQSFARASVAYCFGDYEFAQRIYNYVSNHDFIFSSPPLSQALDTEWPEFTEEQFEEAGDWLEKNVIPDGMPISCFLTAISDTKESLVSTRTEASWLSMMGGGVGLYAGNRAPDEKSTGIMAHLRGYDADTLSYKQRESRRGSMAAYLEIDHPEIMAFLNMRNPVGGDANKKCFNLNNAVNINDNFMYALAKGISYELVDPKHGPTGRFLKAQEVWEKIMETRYETGEPYILFTDNVNRQIPKWITRPLYHVQQSNLCSEITLMTSETRSAVCCLSSLNLERYDLWKNTQIVEDLIRLLDNILEYFIRLAPPELKKAVNSAKKERAVGLGTLGWHSFLQSKDIPFESGGILGATHYTSMIYSKLQEDAIEASKKLAQSRGEAPDCRGSGMRNSHLLALAPNASSSNLIGVSPTIEPYSSNAFTSKGRAGSFLNKNKHLERKLEELGMNTDEVWKSIIINEGSVQHLDLPQKVKDVFKTFEEINPQMIVEQAAIRQKHICQSQSLNIKVPTGMTLQAMSDLHFLGWLKGLKSFYYCRAKPAQRAEIGTGSDKPLNSVQAPTVEFGECLSCD